MPWVAKAASRRLRSSPPAAHCSGARTSPSTLSVMPYSPRASIRSTCGASMTRRRQAGSASIAWPTSFTTRVAFSMSVPYATVTSWLIRAHTRVWFDATRISPLGTVWTTPLRSRRVVRRMLKSSTAPLTPAIVTTSPRLNWFSIRISAPLK